jgi:hypothetical protein
MLGDTNSHFFHQFANGRRKITISCLESDQGEIRGQRDITEHIVDYYKSLFGISEPCQMFLNSEFWPQQLKVLEFDKANLVRDFDI